MFQRKPSWCFEMPGYLAPFSEQFRWFERNFPLFTNFMRFRLSRIARPDSQGPTLKINPDYVHEIARSPSNKRILEARLKFINEKLRSMPDVAEKMIDPFFAIRCHAEPSLHTIIVNGIRGQLNLSRICKQSKLTESAIRRQRIID